ncbi:glycosyltransferase family 2 protein [Aridibaculum aurantiacum]|uniref:glycosyltransferase family 2 protein n=1 Tax=Aridibaculum aurantiacum TaxID=2810307 RepID=UPI001A9588F6|nr:glycosyltransferase family 2 protein [Aridibaculum aurantiacum]
MTISIITVCFNSAKTIAETIESVLSQSYPHIQYIIIDGGSTDGTLEIIRSYGPKINIVVSEPDNGLYDAMNKGISMATGEIIGILNSDDLFYSSTVLQKVANAFLSAQPDIVYGNIWMSSSDQMNKPVRKWIAGRQRPFTSGWHPPHPAVYVKRRCYDDFGFYKPDFAVSSDFEMMLRLFHVHSLKAHYLDEVIVNMRMGGASTGSLKNIIVGNLNIKKAFRENQVSYPLLYPVKRVIKKLKQYI